MRAQAAGGLDGAQGLDGADEGLALAQDAVGESGVGHFLSIFRLVAVVPFLRVDHLGRKSMAPFRAKVDILVGIASGRQLKIAGHLVC